MNLNKESIVKEIQNLLTDHSNLALACEIYDHYKMRMDVKASVIGALVEAIKTNVDSITYNAMCKHINTSYEELFHETDMCSVDCVHAWNRYHSVDTIYSNEVLSNEIRNQYKKEYTLASSSKLEHYADADNYIEYIPTSYVCMIAFESMYEGHVNGMTGKDYFDQYSKGYTLSQSLKDQFEGIFNTEEELMDKSKAGLVIAATEKFFVRDVDASEKLKECPIVDREVFKSQLQESDVLIIYRKPKYIGLAGVALNKVNSWVTGSSFMSIKLVGPKGPQGNTAIGFGARIGSMNCREVPIDYMIDTCAGIVCIRHKEITDPARKKITDYARSIVKENIRYDITTIIKTMFTHRKEERQGAAKILTKAEAANYHVPMICTTLITAAYRGVGIDPGVNFSDKSAWPIDVLKSDKFYPVCLYFDKYENINFLKK